MPINRSHWRSSTLLHWRTDYFDNDAGASTSEILFSTKCDFIEQKPVLLWSQQEFRGFPCTEGLNGTTRTALKKFVALFQLSFGKQLLRPIHGRSAKFNSPTHRRHWRTEFLLISEPDFLHTTRGIVCQPFLLIPVSYLIFVQSNNRLWRHGNKQIVFSLHFLFPVRYIPIQFCSRECFTFFRQYWRQRKRESAIEASRGNIDCKLE